jgi:hypothetical protein
MKSERRHELQTNSLSAWLYLKGPEIWNKYGNHFLLGLIVLIGLIWVIRLRLEAPKKAKQEAAFNLNSLQRQIDYAFDKRKPELISDIPQKLKQTMDISPDPDIQALGYALLGDYHWLNVIAAAPDPTELTGKINSEYEQSLTNADSAYAAVLGQKTKQWDLIAKAHIGRAMVAEELGAARMRSGSKEPNPYWEQAKNNYQAVIDDKAVPESIRENAAVRIKQLKELENPLWVVRRKEAPTSLPSYLDPSGALDIEAIRALTQPMSLPATQPAN